MKNVILELANEGHFYVSSTEPDGENIIINTPKGSFILREKEAVKLANLIMTHYYSLY